MSADDEAKSYDGAAEKQLINGAGGAVTEMLDGFLILNPHLTRLDGFDKVSTGCWSPEVA